MTDGQNLNNRQMQAYAAICLLAFCRYAGIRHGSVDQLIGHLFALLTTKSIPDWEQEGTMLAVTGLGDPLPVDVEKDIPQKYLKLFVFLVDHCVEVGVVDIYGVDTDKPRNFLEICINTVQKIGLELPSPEILSRFRKGEGPWGEPVDETELRAFLTEHGFDLS